MIFKLVQLYYIAGSDVLKPIPKLNSFSLYAVNGTKINTYTYFSLRRKFSFLFILADVSKPIIWADFLNCFVLLVDIKNIRLIDTKQD